MTYIWITIGLLFYKNQHILRVYTQDAYIVYLELVEMSLLNGVANRMHYVSRETQLLGNKTGWLSVFFKSW